MEETGRCHFTQSPLTINTWPSAEGWASQALATYLIEVWHPKSSPEGPLIPILLDLALGGRQILLKPCVPCTASGHLVVTLQYPESIRENLQEQHQSKYENKNRYIMTLNLNRLNVLVKKHRIINRATKWLGKENSSTWCLQETKFRPRDTCRLVMRWRNIYDANGYKRRWDLQYIYAT